MRSVLWLGDKRATDPAATGRQAATLARLHAAGFDVPNGFVLTTAGNAAVSVGRVPEAIGRAVRVALRRMGDVPLSVRSSGGADDLGDGTASGQVEAPRRVKGPEEAQQAIMTFLAPVPPRRVTPYGSGRAATRDAGEGQAPAIMVQRLVPAEATGVGFSADPVTGDRDAVRISVMRGPGDRPPGVVSDPEEWIVRDGRPIEGRMSPPAPWPVAGPASGDPAVPRRVQTVGEPLIEPATAERIAQHVRSIEAFLGAPQRVEWALEGEQFWVVQARPIGMLPVPPDGSTLAGHAWWRDDEHDLAPASALRAAVSTAGESRGFEHMFRLFGVLRERSGHVTVGGLLFGRPILPPGLPPVADGPAYVAALAASAPVMARLPVADAALRDGLAAQLVARWHDMWRVGLEQEARALLDVDRRALHDGELAAHLDAAIDLAMRGLDIHFVTWMPYYLALHELDVVCCELLGWQPGASLRLVTGTSDASSEPTQALVKVADEIASSTAGRAALQSTDFPLERAGDVEPRFRAALDGYLGRFGARPLSGDPSGPTLAERPDVLVGLLRGLVARAGQGAAAAVPPPNDLEARVRASLAARPTADKQRFQRALAAARLAYPIRDGSILWGCELPIGVIRAVALEVGRRLMVRGVLARLEDLFDLEPDEIRLALRGAFAEARLTVARRRAERAWVLAHPAPAVIGELPPPAYRTDALPGALRHIHEAIEWASTLAPRVPGALDPSPMLAGIPGSPGRHEGRVRIVLGENDLGRVEPGDVVVCPTTIPAWAPMFGTAGALVTDVGDVLSHPAILAREHGIPAVLGTVVATHQLHEGTHVTVDGTAGTVTIARQRSRQNRAATT